MVARSTSNKITTRRKPSSTRRVLRCGKIRAVARNPQEVNRFKWVVEDRRYERQLKTPGGGPPFAVADGERWLDLGANIGYFALGALGNGAASVTCVEPEAENLRRLRENLSLNGHLGRKHGRRSRVTVLRALVRGRLSGNARLLLSRKTTRHSVLQVPEAIPSGMAQTIPKVTTLSHLLSRDSYDAVKLNIEGAEREVLLATGRRTWGSVRKLVVEYSFDVFPKRKDYDLLLRHLRKTGWCVHPEGVPGWFRGPGAIWDRRKTLGNDARQIWAFRQN